MKSDYVPQLRDLPAGRVAERKRHLLATITLEKQGPRFALPAVALPRIRVAALTAPVLVLVGAIGVLSLDTGAASGTPALPEALPFSHGSNQQAVTLLDNASALRRQASDGTGPVTYAKTQNYALQVNVGGGTSTSYFETTVRQVWVAADGSAVAKTWLQDTTPAGAAVGPATDESSGQWQDTNKGLPATPAALKAALLATTPANTPASEQQTILAQGVMSQLGEGTATPRQAAALYQLLATLPGVFDAGTVTDNAGVAGQAIGVPTGTFDSGQTCVAVHSTPSQPQMDTILASRHALGQGITYLVLDPTTGQPLEVESIDTPNAPCGLDLPRVPTIEDYNVLLQEGQVAQTGALPS